MNCPQVLRDLRGFEPLRPHVSIDFEFDDERPTILGLSSGERPVSSYWDAAAKRVLDRLEHTGATWLGHNLLTADKPLIESELGVTIPLERCEDSLILYYLVHAELCKGAAKDEDEADPRGMGFLDLWSMASLYTELPQWKQCRGDRCEGPCRVHDVLGYNGLDALAPDVAYPRLRAEMTQKNIPEPLYHHLKQLTLVCKKMTDQGIRINREFIQGLEIKFEENKGKIFSKKVVNVGKKKEILREVFDAPFNPRSPKQVFQWFHDRGVSFVSTEKDEIQSALRHLSKKANPETRKWLENLYDYKDAGKGLKPWFSDRYFDKYGLMHPRFNPTGSSMGRLSSSNPNFQNIPRIGFGQKVRAAIVPRHKDLILWKKDLSQLELRVCLWYSGVRNPIQGDAFSWLVQEGRGIFETAGEMSGKSPRDVSKSVSHGGDYLEGLVVLRSLSAHHKKLIERGALVVHKDWEYAGGWVGFSGTNLATRLFGSASWENRRKALDIQEAYFKRFHQIRTWQKKVTEDAERGFVQTSSGRYLTLLGTPEDKLKMAVACYGQGGGADYCQEAMVKYGEMGAIPLIQIHDELVFERPQGEADSDVLDFFDVMSEESRFMPGFSCPGKVKRGENWLEMAQR